MFKNGHDIFEVSKHIILIMMNIVFKQLTDECSNKNCVEMKQLKYQIIS